MNDERQATIIKIAAMAVIMPRWIGVLLIADGSSLPVEWRTGWTIFSVICAAGMALVEAGAFAFCLRAWRTMTGRAANVLAGLMILSALSVTVAIVPYLMANVESVSMSSILQGAWLIAWAVAVASATFLIVGSVGLAQRKPANVTRIDTNKARTDANTSEQGANKGANDANRDANKNEPVTKDAFLTLWQANGHKSVAKLANDLGVNVRTAQKWVKPIKQEH